MYPLPRCSIGGASGYRASEVTGLMEESTLAVGGKEVEVRNYVHLQQSLLAINRQHYHWLMLTVQHSGIQFSRLPQICEHL